MAMPGTVSHTLYCQLQGAILAGFCVVNYKDHMPYLSFRFTSYVSCRIGLFLWRSLHGFGLVTGTAPRVVNGELCYESVTHMQFEQLSENSLAVIERTFTEEFSSLFNLVSLGFWVCLRGRVYRGCIHIQTPNLNDNQIECLVGHLTDELGLACRFSSVPLTDKKLPVCRSIRFNRPQGRALLRRLGPYLHSATVFKGF